MKLLLCILIAASANAQLTLNRATYPPLLNAAGAGGGPPVPGFTLWLRADDSSSTFTNNDATGAAAANGARVGTWLDRSAAATNHVYTIADGMKVDTGGTDRRPFRSNSWFNGKAALCFQGLEWLQSVTNNYTFGALTGATVVIGMSFNAKSGDAFDNPAGVGSGKLTWRTDNLSKRMAFAVNSGYCVDTTDWLDGRGYCFIGRGWNSNAFDNPGIQGQFFWRENRNGTNVCEGGVAGPFNLPVTDFFCLGRIGQTAVPLTTFFQGAIAEIIVWPFALTDLQTSNVNFYVTNKYDFR